VRGWVYIITNSAMPGLVKVGFSMKDPAVRAKELGGTGVPFPYVVEYDALVHAPRGTERKIHETLAHKRAAKEWFRCTVEEALSAIRAALPDGPLLEQTVSGHRDRNTSSEVTPVSTAKPRATGNYTGNCSKCGELIAITLFRDDKHAKCPQCLGRSEISGFKKTELLL
jgi:hypothetical protein